jgi:predicted SnoaL-like aldol condensation-catalyzing enzyme
MRYNSRLHHIGIGHAHNGTRVPILTADLHIRVITRDGELLRELELDPTRDYQPNMKQCREACVHHVPRHHRSAGTGSNPGPARYEVGATERHADKQKAGHGRTKPRKISAAGSAWPRAARGIRSSVHAPQLGPCREVSSRSSLLQVSGIFDREDVMSDLERNKKAVVEYYELAFNGKQPQQAVEKYVGSQYIQHNPQAPDGPEAFIEFVTSFARQFPELRIDIKRVVAEGDIVVTHGLIKTSPDDRGTVAADFFRLDENGKIVEHWDVLQPFPAESANDHPMF